jgi:hypothetical protein
MAEGHAAGSDVSGSPRRLILDGRTGMALALVALGLAFARLWPGVSH